MFYVLKYTVCLNIEWRKYQLVLFVIYLHHTFLQMACDWIFHLSLKFASHSCERIDMYTHIHALEFVYEQIVSWKRGLKHSYNCCAEQQSTNNAQWIKHAQTSTIALRLFEFYMFILFHSRFLLLCCYRLSELCFQCRLGWIVFKNKKCLPLFCCLVIFCISAQKLKGHKNGNTQIL